MEDLTYIIESLLTLSKWSTPILAVTGFVLFAILYLVWTLHDKVDKLAKNQKLLMDEIKELKKGEGFLDGQ